MKINELVEYCNEEIQEKASKVICYNCNHTRKCPGSCGCCMDQVHLSRGNGERQDYDCEYMVKYYVCKYIHAYASEIEDCLEIIEDKIQELDHIHFLSIGSGPSPDLYAIWKFSKRIKYSKPISYIGYEHNNYWEDVNNKTKELFRGTGIRVQYFYEDVFETFKEKNLSKTNILVLQYVLSHIVYNGREDEISEFFNDLVEKVIMNMEVKGYVVINDINHCIARDKFKVLEDTIVDHGMKIRVHKYYYRFKSNMHPSQMDGNEYDCNDINYDIDEDIEDFYGSREDCRSVQHIIEVFR